MSGSERVLVCWGGGLNGGRSLVAWFVCVLFRRACGLVVLCNIEC